MDGGWRMILVDVQPVVDVVALTLQSGFISNEANAVSLLLISRPETAKTSSIFSFRKLDFVAYYDEITAKKLIDEFLPLVKSGRVRFLLIPDLINCIEKQRSTREQFLALIKSGIDDTGVVRISTFHKQLDYYKLAEGLKFGLITALTAESFRDIRKVMVSSGLMSRFIPFTYDYPITVLKKIIDFMEGREVPPNTSIPQLQRRMVKVEDSPDLFKEFEMVSMKLGTQYGGFGLRAQRNLQRLAKANAVMSGRRSVEREDVEKVISLAKWMNFDFNPL